MDFDIKIVRAGPPQSAHAEFVPVRRSPSVGKPRLALPESCKPPNERYPATQRVWVIFGATGHIGRSLVRTALTHGDLVTAVAWSQEHDKAELDSWSGDAVYWTNCDVRFRETVDAVISQSLEHWGRMDLVSNCVTFGVIGACEDQDEQELRDQFDVNFFGTLHIIQSTLPCFRAQAKGRYLIFSSTSGALGVPGLGPYCATKYAVEGLIESMLYEVDCYNIKATLVQPGHVRRDEPDHATAKPQSPGDRAIQFIKPPTRFSAFKVKKASPPYAGPNAPAGHAKRMITWVDDRQVTSAVRSAELVWQLGHCEYPPLRLLLGTFAVDSIRDRLKSIVEEIEDWKHLHFPPPTQDHQQDQEELAMMGLNSDEDDEQEEEEEEEEQEEEEQTGRDYEYENMNEGN